MKHAAAVRVRLKRAIPHHVALMHYVYTDDIGREQGSLALYLANLTGKDVPELLDLVERHTLKRTATMLKRSQSLPNEERRAFEQLHRWYEAGIVDSLPASFR